MPSARPSVNRATPKRVRRLMTAGRIVPEHRPCYDDVHAGPLLREAEYNAAGHPWTGCGDCASCGSTIHHSQLRRRAS